MTRQEIIIRIKEKTQNEVYKALNRLERKYTKFSQIFKTITVDNGSEFLNVDLLEKSCIRKRKKRTTVYYCHPYSSWERGSNENANQIIRRFIPKGSRIEDYNDKQLEYIQNWINNYPRRIHNYQNANVVFGRFLQAL